MESMMESWVEPERRHVAPRPPISQPTNIDIDRVANLLAEARSPFLLCADAGSDASTFSALVELAELLSIPVLETPGATVSNFPKSHDLHLGLDVAPYLAQMDLALLIENEAPWYPPSAFPKNATVVAIASYPLKDTLVYQVTGAEQYLEGDVATTLRLIVAALRDKKLDLAAIAARRAVWKAHHEQLMQRIAAAEERAESAASITVPLVASLVRQMIPNAIYVDETIVHARLVREHTLYEGPFDFYRAPSGLGQALGYCVGHQNGTSGPHHCSDRWRRHVPIQSCARSALICRGAQAAAANSCV
jgi:acetolactate synthase-1/2/3 large subunit